MFVVEERGSTVKEGRRSSKDFSGNGGLDDAFHGAWGNFDRSGMSADMSGYFNDDWTPNNLSVSNVKSHEV